MRCPTDGAELVMAERQGVEIDYCPSCRGIWLDRGELDKILDRAANLGAAAAPAPAAAPVPPPAPAPERGFERFPTTPGYGGYREDGYRDDPSRDDRYRDDRSRDDRYREGDRRYDERGAVRDPRDPRSPYGRKKKRESWLGDLLDFD